MHVFTDKMANDAHIDEALEDDRDVEIVDACQ